MNIRTDFKSILTLEEIKIVDSVFKRSEDNVDDLSLGLDIDRSIEKMSENKYKISLVVRICDDDNKLNVYVKCIGIFTIERYEQSLIERNALAIMFPYVRSYISTITTQPGMSPIVLPAINIVALLNSKK